MNDRNFRVLLLVSILFGVAGGLYEFVLPYYLQDRGLSFASMGTIFSASALAMFVVRIGLGNLADRWGSKRLYVVSLVSVAVACAATPLTTGLLGLIAWKTLREVGVLARGTAHPILLYRQGRHRFAGFIGKTRGAESLFQAAGVFLAGAGLAWAGTGGMLWIGGLIVGLGGLVLWVGVRGASDGVPTPPGGLRRLLSLDLPRNLRVIMIASFVFSVGLSTSHCFIMPLFFSEKFGVDPSTVSTVMVIHRLTSVAPLLLAGYLPARHYRAIYVGAILFEGLTISAAALIPTFLLAAAVWLFHDLLGAGLWIPIQSAIIQDACRENSRGLDLSKTLAVAALGGSIGPVLAGYLSGPDISAPYLVSGLLVAVSALPLLALRLEPAAARATAAAA